MSPKTALSVGLKIDVDALPADLVESLKAGKVNLDEPATTLALLKLNSLVSLPSSAGSERFLDHGFQHLLIYISKLLDIEAAFAGTVLAELGQ